MSCLQGNGRLCRLYGTGRKDHLMLARIPGASKTKCNIQVRSLGKQATCELSSLFPSPRPLRYSTRSVQHMCCTCCTDLYSNCPLSRPKKSTLPPHPPIVLYCAVLSRTTARQPYRCSEATPAGQQPLEGGLQKCLFKESPRPKPYRTARQL
jgi:hypothetical protein